jgi:hypothetical protein
MKFTRTAGSTTALMCLALLGITVPMGAQTGSAQKKTAFVIQQVVEVPGTVLQPGSYVIRSMGPAPAGSPAGANRLEIVGADESHVYATITSIPEMRPPLTDKATFSFYQSADGSHRAIKAWWPTPDPYPRQEQFVYPTEQALHLIAATKESVLYLRPELLKGGSSTAEVSVPPPIAQVTPAGNAAAALPKTASDLPLLMLAGLICCFMGICLRVLSISLARGDRQCLAGTAAIALEPRDSPVRRVAASLWCGAQIRLRVVYRKG